MGESRCSRIEYAANPAAARVIFIVKNYTGDKLNFGLAAEKAKARGIDVRTVFVEDDVSIQGNDLVGCRGLAGTVFVHKIAGAAVAEGRQIDDVERVALKTAKSLATVAVSLDRCSVPGRQEQEGLAIDELEYGMGMFIVTVTYFHVYKYSGIHNEPGAERSKLASLQQVISRMLGILLKDRKHVISGPQGSAVMINNLGGLSVLELHSVADEVLRQLSTHVPEIRKVFIGSFVTSLDGPGISVTLLQLDSELENLLDAPTTVHAWPKSSLTYNMDAVAQQIDYLENENTFGQPDDERIASKFELS